MRSSGTDAFDKSVTLRELASAQDTAQLAASPLVTADAGTVVVTPSASIMGRSLWLIALIKDRQVADSTGDAGGEPLPPQVLTQIGTQQLTPYAADVGVDVNPRFGSGTGHRWRSRTRTAAAPPTFSPSVGTLASRQSTCSRSALNSAARSGSW